MTSNKCEDNFDFDGLSCEQKLLAAGDSMYAIGGKWKLRILIALSQGHSRFNNLVRTITGISAKVLSAELRDLEAHGFVRRDIKIEKKPIIVEYRLTEYADSLQKVVYALIEWGMVHRQRLKVENRKQMAGP